MQAFQSLSFHSYIHPESSLLSSVRRPLAGVGSYLLPSNPQNDTFTEVQFYTSISLGSICGSLASLLHNFVFGWSVSLLLCISLYTQIDVAASYALNDCTADMIGSSLRNISPVMELQSRLSISRSLQSSPTYAYGLVLATPRLFHLSNRSLRPSPWPRTTEPSSGAFCCGQVPILDGKAVIFLRSLFSLEFLPPISFLGSVNPFRYTHD